MDKNTEKELGLYMVGCGLKPRYAYGGAPKKGPLIFETLDYVIRV